ncbi:FecR family protein [Pedobacter sp. BG31]|uniref:FecR family protein n=1 Tax=Pedobacter sp. BG31 TaxID=3349697 RepID=UPI0035F4B2E2
MDQRNLKKLLNKYLKNKLTESERAELDIWYDSFDDQEGILKSMDRGERLAYEQRMLLKINAMLFEENKIIQLRKRYNWLKISAAAAILIFFSSGLYFFLADRQKQQLTISKIRQDIAPGGNKAILTLANGQQIILNDAKNGRLVQQGTTIIDKTADGDIRYNDPEASTSRLRLTEDMTYNTMTTPRSGQYHLTLADGTDVWLNAASSIRYPTAFKGSNREVEITGEAYFEVAHNAVKPFKVICKGQTIEVLGTHFNINAYTDEPEIKTTLLKGSVKVIKKGDFAMLKPGQQSRVNLNQTEQKIKVLDHADTEEAIAWHLGLFQFKDANIQTVMRQLSRWYDVDIGYEGEIPDRKFTGKIFRNVSALKVSDILSYSNIHFRIEGKKIIVINR